MPTSLRVRQAGQVLILTGLSLVVAIGSVGLAIDSGLAYLAKAKLNAAVDAGAVAGARAASEGDNQAAQTANAKQAAREFFAANYDNGYLGSTPTLAEPAVAFDGGKVTVDVSAQASLPTSLMQVLGFRQTTVGAASQTIRKDLDLAFAMDTSASLVPVAAQVRAAAVSFLEKFNPTTDRVALIHFSAGAVVDAAIRTGPERGFDRAALQRHIENFNFAGFTNQSEGLWHARDQLKRIAPADRSTLRVIVLFSDGAPNTFASYFNFVKAADCPVPANDGAIGVRDGATIPEGLYRVDAQYTEAPGLCHRGSGISSRISELPAYYNAHDPNDTEFPVVTNIYRPVGKETTPNVTARKNITLAARNLPELIADKAKSEGIYVFTLGLGQNLRRPFSEYSIADGSGIDTGEDLLKCMANVAQSTPADALPARCHDAAKPVGTYCFAATEADLKPCFAQLAAEILRITK